MRFPLYNTNRSCRGNYSSDNSNARESGSDAAVRVTIDSCETSTCI